jgi:undecaprenyl-diphosphatase
VSATAAPSRPRALASLRRPVGWVSALVLTASLGASAQLTDGVLENGDLARFDPGVAAAVPGVRAPMLTLLARMLDLLGSTVVVGGLTLVLVTGLWWRLRDRASALWVATTMGAASILVLGAKHLVGRARPGADLVLGPLDASPAFPSGHTLGTTVFLGLLAGLVALRTRSRRARLVAIGGWVFGSLAMAGSRVYLGYHWTTDVLAGVSLGIAVLAVAALLAPGGLGPRADGEG